MAASPSYRPSFWEITLLATLMFGGGFLRFFHPGVLSIDGDNSFHALAAKAILETGRPEMSELVRENEQGVYVEDPLQSVNVGEAGRSTLAVVIAGRQCGEWRLRGASQPYSRTRPSH